MAQPFALLEDRSVISVAGPQARTFLQGLLTNDVVKLQPGAALYAALLTPQGKVLFDFIVRERAGALLLDCRAEDAGRLLKRLTMYRLRAQADLDLRADLAIAWSKSSSPEGAFAGDPRLPELGSRAILPRENMTMAQNGSREYLQHRLRLGVPEGQDFGSDKMFALDGGLEELHGVSFEKGCYVGQELTARMKHRGTARKRLLPVTLRGEGELPPSGSGVRIGSTALGEIASTYGGRGFALIRLDRWREAGEGEASAGGQPVAIEKPAWLHLDM